MAVHICFGSILSKIPKTVIPYPPASLSHVTQAQNHELNIQQITDQNPIPEVLGNPSEKLDLANKSIRYITYQCNNTVAAESEKIIKVAPPSESQGQSKGAWTNLDIIEDCKVICRVDVYARKAPLKIYLKQKCDNLFQMTSVGLQNDIKVYVSDENKNPGE